MTLFLTVLGLFIMLFAFTEALEYLTDKLPNHIGELVTIAFWVGIAIWVLSQ